MTTTEKPKGPASYFPTIEKTYGQHIAYWLTILGDMKEKKHMEQVPSAGPMPCECAGGVPQVAAKRLKAVAIDALNWRNPCWN